MIYDMLDESKLYKCVVENKLARSNINIPFIVGDGSSLIRSKFLHFCYMNQIVGLRTKTPRQRGKGGLWLFCDGHLFNFWGLYSILLHVSQTSLLKNSNI